MAECTFLNSRTLGDYGMPYIVAEVNTSHSGNVDTAKEMIDRVKECGCDCVKFQSWSAETLYSKTYYDANPVAKRIVQKVALSEGQLLELAEYCHAVNVDFCSTAYSKAEVDFLIEKCKAPYIKIASMDINNYPFLDYIGRIGVPIVLSTGMADMAEISGAVKTIEQTGNKQICLLHCISIYPPEISTIRLKNIIGLREMFPDYPVGFSDHSLGVEMAAAAVALGACMIEKHFTLDKSKVGMDNGMAIEPDEMAELVINCRTVNVALGSTERIVLEAELAQRAKMRRSVIAARDLKTGEVLKLQDMDVKRPGDGMEPSRIEELVGKKLLRDVEYDTLIYNADIEW